MNYIWLNGIISGMISASASCQWQLPVPRATGTGNWHWHQALAPGTGTRHWQLPKGCTRLNPFMPKWQEGSLMVESRWRIALSGSKWSQNHPEQKMFQIFLFQFFLKEIVGGPRGFTWPARSWIRHRAKREVGRVARNPLRSANSMPS